MVRASRNVSNARRAAALAGLADWIDEQAAEYAGIPAADVPVTYVRQVLERDPAAAGQLRELLAPAPRPVRARRAAAAAPSKGAA